MKVHKDDRAYYPTKGTNEAFLSALIAHITNFPTLSLREKKGEEGKTEELFSSNQRGCLESLIKIHAIVYLEQGSFFLFFFPVTKLNR